ncbi:alpha/beta hydrolase [Nocardioides sp. T2.26MG-1]|uniref:alpha/beta hydrolase n=1 Tax=Nocardioides sp. T2.26MG-1 TaxID=3041166 RepID=UPI0024776E0E|nr:alpha/beta hydrolase [Nocardioides sp. T2.26MG-1]CAI9412881.1 Acetyl esterase [Nocardioides sp. T2.26MG-1]
MTTRHRLQVLLETLGLRVAMALPERLQRLLGGRAIVRDGQTLAADTQLMLRMQRLVREPGAETLPIPAGREAIRRHAGMTGGRQRIGVARDLTVAGLPARLYTPTTAAVPGPLLLFFHGGGFMYGDLDSHDASCRFLAERSGVRVLAVDYRLGPEQPFPAAYDDALAAHRWLVDHAAEVGADPARLAVGGDSAGGNLAAVVAIEAARAGLPLAFQLLVYPATDAVRETESAALFADGFYLTKAFMDLANQCYIGRTDPRDPRVSPLYADLPAGLAPAYVATAGFDPLRDEGEAYARRLADAGVHVELQRFTDQIHGFFNIVGVGRTSRAANAEIAVKLRAALA